MVFENDPFEDFKRKRQVRELESTFREDAESRHAQLENLVRSTHDKSELADRIESEMEDFFADSQAQVSRIIHEHDHPDQGLIDEKVQEEMSDFFRDSKEAAAEILETLSENEGGLDDAANRMVDHLKNVFEQSMEHIADVQEKYGGQLPDQADAEHASPVPLSPDAGPSVSEPLDGEDALRAESTVGSTLEPPAAGGDTPPPGLPPVDLSALDDVLADPAPAPAAEPVPAETPPSAAERPAPDQPVAPPAPPAVSAPPVSPRGHVPPAQTESPTDGPQAPKVERGTARPARGRVDEEVTQGQAAPPHRILRRQAHLPPAKGRKVAMSAQEIEELRALKEILLVKGIVTREELDEQLGQASASSNEAK